MAKSSAELPPAPDVTSTQWDALSREALDYDAEVGAYRASFDRDTGRISVHVVSTVAAVAEVHPQELPPLYSVVDPDALEALVQPEVATSTRSDVHVSFPFHGHEVTVHSSGIIAVEPPTADGSSEQ